MPKPNVDKETEEILREMAEEGEASDDQKELIGEKKPDNKPEGNDSEDEEDEDKEPKNKEPENKEPKSKSAERPAHYMPLAKYNDEKEKWKSELSAKDQALAEAQAKIAELSKGVGDLADKPEGANLDGKIAKFAEAHDLEPDVVKGLVEMARESAGPALPPEVMKAVQDLVKQNEANTTLQHHEQLFKEELADLQKDFPDEPIDSLKDKLHELAFSEGTNTKSLYEIYFRNIKPNYSKSKSAEPSKGGTNRSGSVDFDKIKDDPEAINNLSDEEFDRFSEQAASSSKKFKVISRGK